jgi:DNA-binding response OmpR family regulator
MASPKILIVEDNLEVRELLKVIFLGKGFEVKDVDLGRDAVDLCEDMPPDIVVLDLTLPDIDGPEVCKKIKAFPQMEGVPVIICSARTHVSERVKGLDAGADDYLTKPFDPAELVARVKVLLRRSGGQVQETRKAARSGDLKLDPGTYQVTVSGRKIDDVTPREFDILHLLLQRSPEAVSRAEISKSILGKDLPEDSRAIDMHIAQIRKKLGTELSSRIITIPGKGYLWST